MDADDVLIKLVKTYGVRRAMTLLGAAILVSASSWDLLIGDEAYSRQGVWTWKRDLEKAKIDPFAIKWGNYQRNVGEKFAKVVEAAAVAHRRNAARATRGTSRA